MNTKRYEAAHQIAPAYHIAHEPCESEGEREGETRQVFCVTRTCVFIIADEKCILLRVCVVVFK